MNDAYSDRPGVQKPSEAFSTHTTGPDGPTPAKGTGKLGSLSQAARSKKLNVARNILIAIGALTVVVNGVMLGMARQAVHSEFEKEIEKIGGRANLAISPAELQRLEDQAFWLTAAAMSVGVALGIAFIVFGLIVKRYPVPVTVVSLVLYIVSSLGFGILDPASLGRGIIIKIFIIIFLFKAVQAARAYEKEKSRSSDLEPAL